LNFRFFSYRGQNTLSHDNITQDIDSFAFDVVNICKKTLRFKEAFYMIYFKDEGVFGIFETICKENELKAKRTDYDRSLNPFTNRILEGIKKADFVIADVSEMRP
jgi:hypothetical protein